MFEPQEGKTLRCVTSETPFNLASVLPEATYYFPIEGQSCQAGFRFSPHHDSPSQVTAITGQSLITKISKVHIYLSVSIGFGTYTLPLTWWNGDRVVFGELKKLCVDTLGGLVIKRQPTVKLVYLDEWVNI